MAEGSFAGQVESFVQELGLKYFAYGALRLPDGATCAWEDTLHSSYPDEWIGRYLEP